MFTEEVMPVFHTAFVRQESKARWTESITQFTPRSPHLLFKLS